MSGLVTRARLFRKQESAYSLLQRTDINELMKDHEVVEDTTPTPQPMEDTENSVGREKSEVDKAEPKEKIVMFLRENMNECSRQRLRALLMTLRKVANVDARVAYKDLQSAFQENGVKVSGRAFQMIIDEQGDTENGVKVSGRAFQMIIDELGDTVGVDYESVHDLLLAAQNESGRDSVLAMYARNDLESREEVEPELRRSELVKRLENHLYNSQAYFDIMALRRAVQGKDYEKSGRVTNDMMVLSCEEVELPLYGSLLTNLLRICEDSATDEIRWCAWPELLSVLDLAQTKAWNNHPEMEALPEKIRQEKLKNQASSEAAFNAKKGFMKNFVKKVHTSTNKTISEDTDLTQNGDMDMEVDYDRSTVNGDVHSPAESRLSRLTSAEKQDRYAGLEVVARSISTSQRPEDHKGEEGYANYAKTDHKGRHLKVLKTISDDLVEETSTELPDERLTLDWIHGYRGLDCRNNIHRMSNGEVVYFVARFAVLYNVSSHGQRHYKEHTDIIRCIAVHANGLTVATGQNDSKTKPEIKAHVRVWRSDTLATLHVITHNLLTKSVSCLAFPRMKVPQQNKNDKSKAMAKHTMRDRLAIVTGGKDKHILLFDAFTGQYLTSSSIDTDTVCDIGFNPKYSEMLVTIGKEHIAWWKIFTSTVSVSALPNFDKYLKAKITTCMAHNMTGDLVTGDSNGTIYLWMDGHNCISNFVKHGHDGPVYSVMFNKGTILSGGKDCMVNCWRVGRNMNKIGTLPIGQHEGGVRTLELMSGKILIGTLNNSILGAVISTEAKACVLSNAKFDVYPITQGHREAVTGVCIMSNPRYEGDLITISEDSSLIAYSSQQGHREAVTDVCIMSNPRHEGDLITISEDSSLIAYSSQQRRPLWKIDVTGFGLTAIETNNENDLLLLGSTEGHLLMLAFHNRMTYVERYKQKITSKPPTVIKYAPDEKLIAVGCGDRSVTILAWVMGEIEEEWQIVGKFKSHVSSITGIDWSCDKLEDEYYLIRSSSQSPDQLFWRVGDFLKEESNTLLKDIEWATDNCCLDYGVLGLWRSKQGRESAVNVVDTNQYRTLVAMGDGRGNLSLFRYPCVKEGAFSHCYKAHLSVDRVRFTADAASIVTTGSGDGCLMQWRIV